jgi:hypothetical protein
MKRTFGSLKGLGIWFLCFSQILFSVGCRQQGNYPGAGMGSTGSTAAGSTAGPDLGLVIYNLLHQQLTTSGTPAEVTALEGQKQPFIDAINTMLPTSVSSNLWATLQKLIPLVKDNTIPNGMGDLTGIMQDMVASSTTIQAMADLSSQPIPSTVDPKALMLVLSRLLSYPQFDSLAQATNQLVTDHPDLVTTVFALISRKLQAISPTTFQGGAINLQGLATALLSNVDTTGLGNLGPAAWSVRLDKNGNPAVAIDPSTGKVFAPFVDDGTGTAAVDASNNPVDSTGTEITTTPFGTDGSRDSAGRALSASGAPLFVFFDAKQTLLGEALILVGNLLQQNVPNDLITVLNATVPQVAHADPNDPWNGFGPQDPLIDLAFGGLEIVRHTPASQLLEGLAVVVNQNPTGFQGMVTNLVVAINLASASGFSTAGQANLLNDLIPLLSDACKPQGTNISAMRALLRSFNSAQAQLQNLPAGFALMMTYNDYGNKVLTGPGLPSAMQRLLGIMARSNGCSPPILGNLAQLFLDTMAGNNQPILGIKLDINTMVQLLNVGILRSLLCSQIQADDVAVLQDFINTGALNAFIPIAKAFSDQGETPLLVQIMLAINNDYPTAMQPNEPAIIKLLNSGAVDQLFLVIDQMTTVTVPSSGTALIDVLADTVSALVDNTTPITDRDGRSFPTVLQLAMQPITDLNTDAANAGVSQNLTNVLTNVSNLLLSTYKDASGNTQLTYGGFVGTLGSTLNFLSTEIPTVPATASTWVDTQEQTISDFLQGRDLAAIAYLLTTINASSQAPIVNAALTGLFTPVQNAQYDALGAILQLLAGILQAPATAPISVQSATDLATVLNFVGAEIAPSAGKLTNMIPMIEKVIAADNGLLILQVLRGALDMGTNGTNQAPISEIMTTLSAIYNADNTAGTTGMTAQTMTNMLNKAINFMDDPTNGLPHYFALISAFQP